MRVLLLAGAYRADLQDMPDRVTPVIAGAVCETVWEHETQEDTDKRWAPMREAFDHHGMDYEWREVWVNLPEDEVRAHFQIPAVDGVVEPAKDKEDSHG